MRTKAPATPATPACFNRDAKGNAPIDIKAPLKVMKPIGRPTKTPTGKGLGKAGAKRLGQQLRRAIILEESKVNGKASLPKTPVRLLKHLIKTEAENAPETSTAKPTTLPHVPPLVLNVVSLCKHRGGITMAELKQTLTDGGFNVSKNNRRVNVVTQRLVNNETLVRTTRNASFRLNNKKQTDTKQVRKRRVKSPKPKGDLQQSRAPSKSSKRAEKPQRQARKTPKQKGRTRRAAAKSHKPRRETPKATRKSPKRAGKKHRSAANRAAQVRKAPRAQRRRRKQN